MSIQQSVYPKPSANPTMPAHVNAGGYVSPRNSNSTYPVYTVADIPANSLIIFAAGLGGSSGLTAPSSVSDAINGTYTVGPSIGGNLDAGTFGLIALYYVKTSVDTPAGTPVNVVQGGMTGLVNGIAEYAISAVTPANASFVVDASNATNNFSLTAGTNFSTGLTGTTSNQELVIQSSILINSYTNGLLVTPENPDYYGPASGWTRINTNSTYSPAIDANIEAGPTLTAQSFFSASWINGYNWGAWQAAIALKNWY